jgi:hypothetical protein
MVDDVFFLVFEGVHLLDEALIVFAFAIDGPQVRTRVLKLLLYEEICPLRQHLLQDTVLVDVVLVFTPEMVDFFNENLLGLYKQAQTGEMIDDFRNLHVTFHLIIIFEI